MGVTEKEVEKALQKIKRGKAPGPSGAATDLLKYAGETGVRKLKKCLRFDRDRREGSNKVGE